ncbi:MAG: hypothetical protein ACRDRA_09765 [Pseudonocardiaceae bacterium]
MTVGVGIHWTFRVIGDVDLFEYADAVTEALLEQEKRSPGVLDSAVSVDRERKVVEIEVTAEGADDAEAVATGQAAVTAAVQAAGAEVVSLVPTDLSTTVLAPA